MMGLLWKWLCSFFTADKIGILLRTLLIKSTVAVASEIFNVENQKKAYEFVKQLHNDQTLSNSEKAQRFNLQMLIWAKEVGKVLSTSVINCLREMAVAALKTEKNAEVETQKTDTSEDEVKTPIDPATAEKVVSAQDDQLF